MSKTELKFVCPECGGRIYTWEELLVTEKVPLRPTNGKPGRKTRSKPEQFPCGDMWGLGCYDCGASVNAALRHRIDAKWLHVCDLVWPF